MIPNGFRRWRANSTRRRGASRTGASSKSSASRCAIRITRPGWPRFLRRFERGARSHSVLCAPLDQPTHLLRHAAEPCEVVVAREAMIAILDQNQLDVFRCKFLHHLERELPGYVGVVGAVDETYGAR